jgi:CheY-like chemotaxis protein
MATLLIVEDHRESREALAELLQADGHSILTAENGQEALDQLSTIPDPRLILLDLCMPLMDGWEFLRVLRIDQALTDSHVG